jgi:hypothetical protein
MTSYLGIDPGLMGGLAVISDKAIDLKFAMPTITITKNGSSKKEIDMDGVLSFFYGLPRPLHCCIEEQHAFRGNLASSCTVCRNYGVLLGLLCISNIEPNKITSDEWQSHFGIVPVKKHPQGKTTKQQAFEICSELYPNEIFGVSAKKPKYHDGIGDACLITRFCQLSQQEEGKGKK